MKNKIIITVLLLISFGLILTISFSGKEDKEANIKVSKIIDKYQTEETDENKNDDFGKNSNSNSNNIQENQESEFANKKMNVDIPELYFNDDKGAFKIKFNGYEVPRKKAILNATLTKLFELRSGDHDGSWNGLNFKEVSIDENSNAIVKLTGSWYPVGDLSGMFFLKEIDAAVFQFPNIKEVEVWVNDQIFDWCVDDMSDGEGGCPENKRLWKDTRDYYFSKLF